MCLKPQLYGTVDAQIFVGAIFRGLNFRGDKYSWVVVAHENLTPTKIYLLVVHETGMARHEEDVKYQKMHCDKAISLRYRASAIDAEGILDDSKPLGSGRPLSVCGYFRSAIVEVQACVHTVILYMANYSLAQFFMGLIFVGNAHPWKLNSHENFCVYGIYYASYNISHTHDVTSLLRMLKYHTCDLLFSSKGLLQCSCSVLALSLYVYQCLLLCSCSACLTLSLCCFSCFFRD